MVTLLVPAVKNQSVTHHNKILTSVLENIWFLSKKLKDCEHETVEVEVNIQFTCDFWVTVQ